MGNNQEGPDHYLSKELDDRNWKRLWFPGDSTDSAAIILSKVNSVGVIAFSHPAGAEFTVFLDGDDCTFTFGTPEQAKTARNRLLVKLENFSPMTAE